VRAVNFSEKLREALVESSKDSEPEKTALTLREIFLKERMEERRRAAAAKQPRSSASEFFRNSRKECANWSGFEERALAWRKLADAECRRCLGWGLRFMPRSGHPVCDCVWRTIFCRALSSYWRLDTSLHPIRKVTKRGVSYSFPSQEYRADFELICLKLFTKNSMRWHVVRLHFLSQVQWKPCVAALESTLKRRVSRGEFFHEVYLIEAKCGRALLQVRPYPLYPIDEYFHKYN
jgi:hypothetical protein